MLYKMRIKELAEEKNLESRIDPLNRTIMISDPKGHTIELSQSVVEKMNSRQTYELLRTVF